MAQIIEHKDGSLVFVGARATELYRALAITGALRLYQRSKILVNRQWTLINMMASASNVTGKVYTRAQVSQAIADLEAWITEAKQSVEIIKRD